MQQLAPLPCNLHYCVSVEHKGREGLSLKWSVFASADAKAAAGDYRFAGAHVGAGGRQQGAGQGSLRLAFPLRAAGRSPAGHTPAADGWILAHAQPLPIPQPHRREAGECSLSLVYLLNRCICCGLPASNAA